MSSGLQSVVLQRAVGSLVDLGAPPELVTFARAEVLANVAMIIPVGALAALAFVRARWQDVAAYAFLGALGIELLQGLLLSARSPSSSDVVANTLGALAGALAVSVVRRLRDRWSR